jgi:hypothetical protein
MFAPHQDLSVSNLVVDNVAVIRGRLVAPSIVTNSLTVRSDVGTVGTLITSEGSSTDNAVVRWDGTSGQFVQNSSVTLSDTGAFNVVNSESTLQINSADVVRVNPTNFNTSIGVDAGPFANVNQCTYIGQGAGFGSSGSGGNVAIGYNALHDGTGAGFNTVIGNRAFEGLHNGNTPFNNVVIGRQALGGSLSGATNFNVVIGSLTCSAMQSGVCNTVINGGSGSATGSNNTVIGCGAKYADATDNSIVLGVSAESTNSNQLVIGNEAFRTGGSVLSAAGGPVATFTGNLPGSAVSGTLVNWLRVKIGNQFFFAPLWQ